MDHTLTLHLDGPARGHLTLTTVAWNPYLEDVTLLAVLDLTPEHACSPACLADREGHIAALVADTRTAQATLQHEGLPLAHAAGYEATSPYQRSTWNDAQRTLTVGLPLTLHTTPAHWAEADA